MSTTLGKRKRAAAPAMKASVAKMQASEDNVTDLQNIFRRAFEAKFNPLPVEGKKTTQEEDIGSDEDDEVDEDDDWDGLSEDEEEDVPKVQVVEVGTITAPELSRAEMKAFMVWPLSV